MHHLLPSTNSLPATLCVAALVLTSIAGCGSRKPSQDATQATPNAPIEAKGNWFCQPAAPGATDPWECVQDAALAKNPKPDRLPDAGPSTNHNTNQTSDQKNDPFEDSSLGEEVNPAVDDVEPHQ